MLYIPFPPRTKKAKACSNQNLILSAPFPKTEILNPPHYIFLLEFRNCNLKSIFNYRLENMISFAAHKTNSSDLIRCIKNICVPHSLYARLTLGRIVLCNQLDSFKAIKL